MATEERSGGVTAPAEHRAGDGNTDGSPMLVVDDVHKRFGGIQAVDGASFDVAEGSITALIGPNGAGKTTLFNVVTGFYRGDRGSVTLQGRQVFRDAPHRIANLGMVRTFQITKALGAMPVIDNMMLAAPDQPGEKLRGYLGWGPWALVAAVLLILLGKLLDFASFLAVAGTILLPVAIVGSLVFLAVVGIPRSRRREKEVRERALELLDTFNLRRLADDYAGTLSGGQRKLLEFARALMAEPKLLMLDEPMAGINPTLGARLLDHIQQLRRERGMTVLFVEHDMEVVMGHSDRVIVMAEGRVIAAGAPEEVRRDQRVIDAYLGGGEQAKP